MHSVQWVPLSVGIMSAPLTRMFAGVVPLVMVIELAPAHAAFGKPSCVAVELPYLQFVYVVPVGLTVTDLTACATVLRVTLRLAGVAAEAETVVTRATVAAARAPQAAPFDEPVPPPRDLVSRIL